MFEVSDYGMCSVLVLDLLKLFDGIEMDFVMCLISVVTSATLLLHCALPVNCIGLY